MRRFAWFGYAAGGLCVLLSLVAMVLCWRSPVAQALREGKRINGLLIGSDYEDHTRHSDTLMFVSYEPTHRFLDVLSIPRDTHVQIPGLPFVHRINEVFAYEYAHSHQNFAAASTALAAEVETLLSTGAVQPIQIPYYFTIDYEGFRAMIDAMGGVYVHVLEPMNYDDHWGHLHIHFQPGTYWMNGHTALLYVRFRGASADRGRVLRQQLFLKQLLDRFKNPILLMRLPHYARLLWSGIHTNFSPWDLTMLFLEGRQMTWSNLRLAALPGSPLGNLWKMNPEDTQTLVALMQSTAPAAWPRSQSGSAESHAVPTVEIWNASNHPNAARAVMNFLRHEGFDVVLFGNFATRQDRTLVIDRTGDLRPAQAVARALYTVHPEVITRIDPSRQVDVSVVLGNDCPAGLMAKWGW